MRLISCSAAVAATLWMMTPTAQAVTNLGVFTGWTVFGVSGDTDLSAYPDIRATVAQSDGFKVIKFKLPQPLDLRLDLAWLQATDTLGNSVGMNIREDDRILNFALRAADGSVLTPTPGPTYFSATTLVPSYYGTIQVPRTTPDPATGLMYTLNYKTTQQSTAQLYKALPAGDYTVTVLVERLGSAYPPRAEVGLYTGPATDFATYQNALAAPINLGASSVVAGDLNASGITTTTGPNPPHPVVGPCPLFVANTAITNGRFDVAVTVSNPDTAPLTGWTVNGTYNTATVLYAAKNAKVSQKLLNLKTFTATPLAANATIPAGGSTSFTFSGSKGTNLPVLNALSLTYGGKTCSLIPAAPQ
jgi:hypothetical protein